MRAGPRDAVSPRPAKGTHLGVDLLEPKGICAATRTCLDHISRQRSSVAVVGPRETLASWALFRLTLGFGMADESLLNKVHDLSDLELAVLLCLVSREHCLISTLPEALDDVVAELKLVCFQVWYLHFVLS